MGGYHHVFLLMGDIFLYMHDVCNTRGVLITPSLHASCISSSLFLEEVFLMRFSLFLYFVRDFIAFVHGYLAWPSNQDPHCILYLAL